MFDNTENYQLKMEKGQSVENMPEPEIEELSSSPEEAAVAEPQVPEKSSAASSTESKVPTESFKELREKAQREERERLRLEREKEELLALLKQQQKPTEAEQDFDLNLKDDDLAEGKHLAKLKKEIKALKDEYGQYKKQSYESLVEQKLLNDCKNFYEVCTTENLQALRKVDPDLADTLSESNNLYSKGKLAYEAIKRYGIYKENTYELEHQHAHKNATKPRTVTSLSPQQGDSPLSKANAFANGLTPELQKKLLAEMREAQKRM